MTSGSHSPYASDRKSARFPLNPRDEPFVEFELADGSRWQLSVLEISDSGMSFGFDDELIALSVGSAIDNATIHAGASRIDGSLRIVHITPGFASGTACGAMFTPSTLDDGRALAALLAELAKGGSSFSL
jgi:hypothetical protein